MPGIIDKMLIAESFGIILNGVDNGLDRQQIWDSLPSLNQEVIDELIQQFGPDQVSGCPVLRLLLSDSGLKRRQGIVQVVQMGSDEQDFVIQKLKAYIISFPDCSEAHDGFNNIIKNRIGNSAESYAAALNECDSAKLPPHIAFNFLWLIEDDATLKPLFQPVIDKLANTETRISVIIKKRLLKCIRKD